MQHYMSTNPPPPPGGLRGTASTLVRLGSGFDSHARCAFFINLWRAPKKIHTKQEALACEGAKLDESRRRRTTDFVITSRAIQGNVCEITTTISLKHLFLHHKTAPVSRPLCCTANAKLL